jgi:hypothetical protein
MTVDPVRPARPIAPAASSTRQPEPVPSDRHGRLRAAKVEFGDYIDALLGGRFDEATARGRRLRALGFSIMPLPGK